MSAGSSELMFSRLASLVMLLIYGALLVFQLHTHRHVFDADPNHDSLPPTAGVVGPSLAKPRADSTKLLSGAQLSSSDPTPVSANIVDADPEAALPEQECVTESLGGHDEGEDEIELSFWGCILWLTALAVLIAFLSGWIVDTIETAALGLKVPLPFLSTIVLPIVGNAAEHVSAITFAMRNRMELTMGVAVGSATQIAMLVMPLSVVVGWMCGQPLDLNLSAFETVVFFGSVLLTIVVVQHASSHWLKGTTLLAAYSFLCMGFWLHRDPMLEEE